MALIEFSALICWALSRMGARADSTAVPTAAALKYHVRFVIAALLPPAFAPRCRTPTTDGQGLRGGFTSPEIPTADGQSAAGCMVYSASLTCSARSVPWPCSPVSDIARWTNRELTIRIGP